MEPKAAQRPAPATLGSLDEAEVCQTLADYHGPLGRTVMGIVLRQHLDSQILTPTEVIHSFKHLKALLEQGQLVENALIKVTAAQARAPGQDARTRRLAIQNAIGDTQAKARGAQIAFSELPKSRPMVEQVMAIESGKTPTGDFAYDLRVALSLELTTLRSWSGKFDRLNQLLQRDRDERLVAAIDGCFADILSSAAAVQELQGAPLSPGSMATTLCELVLGRTTVGSALGPNRMGLLNAMFRQGKLPQARAAVLDRIRRILRAPQPLGRVAADDAQVLKVVMGHLLTREGVVGDAPMAEALAVRYSRRLEQGGATAFRQSVLAIAEIQADLFARLRYLLAAASSPAGERLRPDIVEAMEAALNNELLIENVIVQSPDLDLVRQNIIGTVEAIGRSPLLDDVRARLAERLGNVVDDFTKRGRLVHRLRQVEPVLRRRVIRLAELATSGLVRGDGAYPLLRQHILEIAKQPQFQMELSGQQGSDVAQAEVRRLFELLERLRQAPPPSGLTVPIAAVRASAAEPVPATVMTAPTVAQPIRPVSPAARSVPMPTPPAAAVLEDTRCPSCFEQKASAEPCAVCGYPKRSDGRPGIHLTPGTALQGRYRVGRVLGQGGFGATYLGWDERLHVKVAVKEYYPANLISRVAGGTEVAPFSDEHAKGFTAGLAKFLDEARMLARLRDVKEIVGVQDFFEENGTAYIVMELLEGGTLKKYIAESGGKLDARRVLAVMAPIMKALQTVHDQGLIHRDISPDNIFLTASGERKLLDFGAARHAAGQAANLTVILKPGYAPPEQYSQEGKQGPWTDVYALCATMYCALTGKPPPDATGRFMNDNVPKPTAVGAQLTPAFEKVLMGGLAMRWQDRPQSMKDLLKAFTASIG
ncbi:protein kinase domain-containing protein [Azospirillum sp.]|uniref:serine/threonine-protein kinase n=1 Tax=Azospirillum sp. TaxID=34012 RepID=UPI003D75EB83